MQAYAFKYQANLSHLILGSTFASTRQLNAALERMKQGMPADKRARLEALEKDGLFGKGEPWEHGRYPEEYAKLAWGIGYFPALYGARPDANYDPVLSNTANSWELYRAMWGSHGEFVVDGNLKEVEWVDRLQEIKVPTLIVVGDHDQSDPAMSREMNARSRASKLVVLPNLTHDLVDQPELRPGHHRLRALRAAPLEPLLERAAFFSRARPWSSPRSLGTGRRWIPRSSRYSSGGFCFR